LVRARFRNLEEEPEGKQVKQGELKVSHGCDPVNRLTMNRMQSEDDRRHKAQGSVSEHSLRNEENETDHGSIQDHVGQMKSVGQGSKELVTEEVSQRHQRAIIIGHALRADVRPYIRGKDFPQVGKAAQVGIEQDLTIVILDKAVPQGVKVGQGRDEDKDGE
jgi:hypothetical protein